MPPPARAARRIGVREFVVAAAPFGALVAILFAPVLFRTIARALDDMLTAAGDASRRVALEGPERPAAAASEGTRVGDVQWDEDRPDEVSVRVDSARGGWLVLLDSWDPEWEATVRGRPAVIVRANFNFRAVRVAAGRSTVTFHFRPSPVAVGAAISIAATGGCVVFLAWQAVRRRRARAAS